MKHAVRSSLGIFQTVLGLGTLLCVLSRGGTAAQGVTFALGSYTAQPGDTVTASVTVTDFNDVADFQFSLNWDPTVLSYSSLGNFGLNGLAAGLFNTTLTGSAELAVSWDDVTGLGTTVSDGTVIFTISFDVIGSAGSMSSLALADVPTTREVDSEATLSPLPFISVNGQVTVPAKAVLTVTGVTANNKVYDGTTTATLNLSGAVLNGVVSGDTVTLNTGSAAGSFADKTVGNGKTVTVSGMSLGGADAAKYSLAQPTATANITAVGLTVTGVTANSKLYDGTTAATLNVSGAALSGVISGDTVSLNPASAAGSFADKTVGNGKTVTVSGMSLSGADAGNYSLTQPTATANITALGLTVTGVTANSKIYDGTTTATLNVSGAALSGVISGDTVTLNTASAAGSFADKTVGNGKTVTVSGLGLSGADAANYSLAQPTATANITAKGLTVTGVTANNKVYDGTTTATLNLSGAALSGVSGGDTVTLNTGSAVAAFADNAVGAGKPVNISGLSLSGADASNYSLAQPSATANITAAPLLVQVADQARVVGQTNPVWMVNYTGFVNGDNASSLGGTLTFSFTDTNGVSVPTIDPNTPAGTYVIIPSGLTSADYSLTFSNGTLVIANALLAVAVNPATKVYGTANPAFSVTITGFVNGDTASVISGSPQFSTSAGVYSPVGVYDVIAGLGTLSATNYGFVFTNGTLTVTPAPLTVTGVAANNKVYDGASTATLNLSGAVLNGVLNGDTVSLNPASGAASFADKAVGNGKTVTVSGLSLSGSGAGNYSLTQPATTANITPLGLTVTGVTANSKVYDRTPNATLNLSGAALSGVITGDAVSLNTGGATGNFADKTVGNGKTVTVSGLSLGGTDAGNYSLTQPATTASITPLGLTVTGVTANNKVYDGTTTATLNLSGAALGGVLSGDTVTLVTAGAAAALPARPQAPPKR